MQKKYTGFTLKRGETQNSIKDIDMLPVANYSNWFTTRQYKRHRQSNQGGPISCRCACIVPPEFDLQCLSVFAQRRHRSNTWHFPNEPLDRQSMQQFLQNCSGQVCPSKTQTRALLSASAPPPERYTKMHEQIR